MADPIVVMKRYELKYLLDAAQTEFLRERLAGRMRLDQYGRTSIASLYYDTPDYRLIRTSVEKPSFKEKILKSVCRTKQGTVFGCHQNNSFTRPGISDGLVAVGIPNSRKRAILDAASPSPPSTIAPV